MKKSVHVIHGLINIDLTELLRDIITGVLVSLPVWFKMWRNSKRQDSRHTENVARLGTIATNQTKAIAEIGEVKGRIGVVEGVLSNGRIPLLLETDTLEGLNKFLDESRQKVFEKRIAEAKKEKKDYRGKKP